MSIYKRYKHGASIDCLINEHGLQTVFNSLKRQGLSVKIHDKRLKILNPITNHYIFLK